MSETAIEVVGLYTMVVKRRVYVNPLVSYGVTRRRNYYWKTLLIPKVKKNILYAEKDEVYILIYILKFYSLCEYRFDGNRAVPFMRLLFLLFFFFFYFSPPTSLFNA